MDIRIEQNYVILLPFWGYNFSQLNLIVESNLCTDVPYKVLLKEWMKIAWTRITVSNKNYCRSIELGWIFGERERKSASAIIARPIFIYIQATSFFLIRSASFYFTQSIYLSEKWRLDGNKASPFTTLNMF